MLKQRPQRRNKQKEKGKTMPMIRETESHIVVQLTSESGSHYEVGYPKSTGYTVSSVLALTAESDQIEEKSYQSTNTPAGFEKLEWAPGKEGFTSEKAQKLGIIRGYVNEGGQVFTYRINFFNSRGWWFAFADKSSDIYRCNTLRNGYHYIDYNSQDPMIVGVR